MSSPIVYAVTAAQAEGLRAIKKGGRPAAHEWRVFDALVAKGLVQGSNLRSAQLTPLGQLLEAFLRA